MKFELVGFYPITEKNRKANPPNLIATIHLYVIDYKLDLRGIRLTRRGKRIFFVMPHIFGLDPETGEEVSYPMFRWTDPADHKAMLDFLIDEVKTVVLAEVAKIEKAEGFVWKDNSKRNVPARLAHSASAKLKNGFRVKAKGGSKNSA
jgi:hypothetical protein